MAALNIPARQMEFLGYICGLKYLSYRQIAKLMFVSRHAIDHYFRYFSKLYRIRSRGGLVVWAREQGIFPFA